MLEKRKRHTVDEDVAERELTVGERLRLTREAFGFTQVFMARLCGISKQAWNNYERRGSSIDVKTAQRICRHTGVTLDWIFAGNWAGIPFDKAVIIQDALQAEMDRRR